MAAIDRSCTARAMTLQELKELKKQLGVPLLGHERHGALASGEVAAVPASFGEADQEVVAGALEFLEGVQPRVEAWVVLCVEEEGR